MSEQTRFFLPPLPYEADALFPAYGTGALCTHHDRIFAAHVDALNILLDGYRALQGKSVYELLYSSKLPRVDAEAIKWHCGAVFAHTLYFRSMSAPSGGYPIPGGRLAEKMRQSIGSYAEFCYRFREAALSVSGVGFLYLVFDKRSKTVRLLPCRNYDVPGGWCTALLCMDLWEHAYFSDYAEDRAAAVDAFLSVVNWREVEHNLSKDQK